MENTGLSAAQMGHMLGNGMSVNVLGRILPRALFAAGLIASLPHDHWAEPRRPKAQLAAAQTAVAPSSASSRCLDNGLAPSIVSGRCTEGSASGQ